MMIKKFLGLTLMYLFITSASAQTTVEKVEASFIASFMRYIKWPEQESLKTFTVGVYGKNNTIMNELNRVIHGKNIGLAKVTVMEVTEIEDIKKCQVLFIPNGRSAKLKKDLEALNNKAIMTVTEEQDYTPDYSIINFRVLDNKLTFQLNHEIASKKNIVISNKLIQMAKN
ncbi:YfiR family protein [Plebeiibacterium marinum]|uniref:YfiR family protein n=1 Tax=Plebeiibacterium marinum TaxID=2992111 RepID=A0AAE3MBL1_9BACT|nr:YfiR family protein [Plebeiobacterium marinum]MCW3804604.1 YfiR family protein [Plebeiobacterium marinum]